MIQKQSDKDIPSELLAEIQIQHFRGYSYTTTPTLSNATEIRAMRAGLKRFKRERLGHNVATEVVWRENLHKDV